MHTLSHAHEQKTYQKPGRAESYSCMYCGMVFSYEDMLLLHVVSRHKQLNGKVPLDLSLKSSLSQKRSHEVMSHRLPSHANLLQTRSSEATPLTTNPPHPSTVLAAAMMSFQSSTYAACGSTSDERPPSKRPRTSSTSSLPIAISPKCKTEPLTPPASDPDEKQTRSSSASSQPSTSASTPSPLNQLHTKQSSQSLDKPNHDSCASVDSTTRRSTPSEAPNNSGKSSSKNEAGGAMNPIQALQRALGDSKEMFYFCIHCNQALYPMTQCHGSRDSTTPLSCKFWTKNPNSFSSVLGYRTDVISDVINCEIESFHQNCAAHHFCSFLLSFAVWNLNHKAVFIPYSAHSYIHVLH